MGRIVPQALDHRPPGRKGDPRPGQQFLSQLLHLLYQLPLIHEHRHLILDHDPAIDYHRVDAPAVYVVDKTVDGIEKGPPLGAAGVEEDQIGLLTDLDGTDVIAEAQGHHPDITFGWGYAHIVFFTHKIKGLHGNDFIMAAKVDALA